MKHTWTRTRPTVDPGLEALAALLAPLFPGADVLTARQVGAGLVNTIHRVTLRDRPPVAVKIGQRGVAAAGLEHAVCRRVADVVPVPAALAWSPEEPVSGHPVTVWAWADGVRLDGIGAMAPARAGAIAAALGGILARLHRIELPRTGILGVRGGDLEVVEPFDLHGAGLVAFAEQVCAGEGRVRLEPGRADRLLAWLRDHAAALDPHLGQACLCHGDYGPENVLLDDDRLTVLDWEFACAGVPLLDLGHLLRAPLGDEERFVAAIGAGYRAAGGELPDDWPFLGRLVDLFAWLSFLERDDVGPEAVRAARRHVDRLLASR